MNNNKNFTIYKVEQYKKEFINGSLVDYKSFKCKDRVCDIRKIISESSHESVYKNPQYARHNKKVRFRKGFNGSD